MNLTYEEKSHSYFLNGDRIPGMSEILAGVGLIETRFFGKYPEATYRGSVVHDICSLLALGVPPDVFKANPYYNYIKGFNAFLGDEGYTPEAIEEMICDIDLKWAGRVDLILKKEGKFWLADIKTGRAATWHGYQLNGYKMAAEKWLNLKIEGVFSIYLSKSGYKVKHNARIKGKVTPYSSPFFTETFLSAVNIFKARGL